MFNCLVSIRLEYIYKKIPFNTITITKLVITTKRKW